MVSASVSASACYRMTVIHRQLDSVNSSHGSRLEISPAFMLHSMSLILQLIARAVSKLKVDSEVFEF